MNLQRNPKAADGPAAPAPSARHAWEASGQSARQPAQNTGQKTAMSTGEFTRLADRVQALTGIVLPLHKRQLVISRLRKRLRALGIDGFGAYLAYLDSPAGEAESGEMINVITTNLTAFFREGHHFEDMAQVLAPLPGEAGTTRRRRIWSGRLLDRRGALFDRHHRAAGRPRRARRQPAHPGHRSRHRGAGPGAGGDLPGRADRRLPAGIPAGLFRDPA